MSYFQQNHAGAARAAVIAKREAERSLEVFKGTYRQRSISWVGPANGFKAQALSINIGHAGSRRHRMVKRGRGF